MKSKAEVPDIDDSDSSAKSATDTHTVTDSSNKKTNKKTEKVDKDNKKSEDHEHHHHHHHHHHHKTDKKKKERDKKKKGKDKAGPMHFTAINEPVAISQDGEFDGELPEEVFREVMVLSLDRLNTYKLKLIGLYLITNSATDVTLVNNKVIKQFVKKVSVHNKASCILPVQGAYAASEAVPEASRSAGGGHVRQGPGGPHAPVSPQDRRPHQRVPHRDEPPGEDQTVEMVGRL